MRYLALILALQVSACTYTEAAIDVAEEKGAEAIEQRQAVADKLLRYHVKSLCMANLDSIYRVLTDEQRRAVPLLCGRGEDLLRGREQRDSTPTGGTIGSGHGLRDHRGLSTVYDAAHRQAPDMVGLPVSEMWMGGRVPFLLGLPTPAQETRGIAAYLPEVSGVPHEERWWRPPGHNNRYHVA